ncbi:MAG: ABC transporter permease, partial [Bacteroidota bacterium]
MIQPPKYITRLIAILLPEDVQEDILGDLIEWYQERSAQYQGIRLRWVYIWHSLSLWRLFQLPLPSFPFHTFAMLRHYFKIALRHLFGARSYALINLGGLAFGLATTLLILAYIQYENGFDQFHENKDRLYKVQTQFRSSDGMETIGLSSSIVSPIFKREFPEIEAGVRLLNVSGFSPPVIKIEDQTFQEDAFYYADSTFFTMFSFSLIEGNPQTALTDPATLVISQTLAKKYFPEGDALGQTIQVGKGNRKITGIMADMPAQSQMQINILGSFSSLRASKNESWFPANYYTYLLLKPGADIKALNSKIPDLLHRELEELLQE